MPLQRVSQVWRDTARRLRAAGLHFGQGTEDAEQEAAWMLLHCLGWDVPEGFAQWPRLQRRVVPAPARERLAQLLRQRVRTHRPLAYLLGEAWLQGRRFVVDERSIVPRSLIAELLEHGLDPWLAQAPRRIADICTGGGSLAVLAAHRWPQAQVSAADLSAPALELARANVRLHGLQDRVQVSMGDLFEAFDAEARFDLVLCNPPYVNAASMAALPREFRHEPALALAGGSDGMQLVRRLLEQAPRYLAPGGVLVVEIGHERAHFESAFPTLPVVWLPVSAGSDAVFLVEAGALGCPR